MISIIPKDILKVNMGHDREFGRRAESYERLRLIQTRVAQILCQKVKGRFDYLLDLGCGSGSFYRAWHHPFVRYHAIDIAPQMVALHPSGPGVVKEIGDFDDPALFKRLRQQPIDLIVSASALQWSRNLSQTIAYIASLQVPVALAIFTSGTFATLHRMAGITSPIRSFQATSASLGELPSLSIERLGFRLYFRDKVSLFGYIKQSGVSGGYRRLSVGDVRSLMAHYPLSYLEFELLVAVSKKILK